MKTTFSSKSQIFIKKKKIRLLKTKIDEVESDKVSKDAEKITYLLFYTW